jgi:SAM-dependent methyltransferase
MNQPPSRAPLPFDPTRRFSSRVENYVKYRPRYPEAILGLLRRECGMSPNSVVADIGSGPGFLAQLFLANGNRVYGVEPNREMREAGERLLAEYGQFVSVEGTAEQTTLEDASADFVTAGQAYHWFEAEAARSEFRRILRPDGWVVLVWNDRRNDSTPFLERYERLLHQWAPEYHAVDHKQIGEDALLAFYGPGGFRRATYPNRQLFDYAGLQGRLLSSSYAPEAGHPNHEPMLAALRELYSAHQRNGTVAFEYDTLVYYGHLTD